MTNEGFQKVQGRGRCRTLIKCGAQGGSCNGTCPAFRIVRGADKAGVGLAECRVCSATFSVGAARKAVKEHDGKGSAKTGSIRGDKPQDRQKAPKGNSSVQKELAALKKELEALKAAKATSGPPPKGSQPSADVPSLSEEDQLAVNALHSQILQLRELGPELRESLCEAKGGYEAFVASLGTQRQAIFARHRGTMPLDIQKSKSEHHLKAMHKQKDEADSLYAELQMQSVELEGKLAKQLQCVSDAEAKLQAAKLEAAAIAQAAALRATAPDGPAAQATQVPTSAVTAHAVKSFFHTLPPAVADHPEGIGACQQVMALLEKLDSAAKSAAAPAAHPTALPSQEVGAPPGKSDDEMQLDDDLLGQMAEAATPPAGEGEGEVEARKLRVAETKGRLRSKKGDLEVGLAKVRKTAKK